MSSTEPSAAVPDASAIGAPTPRQPSLPAWFAPLFYLGLAILFLWRATLTGDVFLPANLLAHIAPWSSAPHPEVLPPWNPLRWDGIGQFYPWRHFAAQTLHAGNLPLWNPYQFCGTPFVANSQSAVFYPLNIIFYILPVARAFGVSAVVHLTLCGWFLFLFLRGLGCRYLSALLGGVIYAYSAWQINWLQLPTFLATSCWFPLLLRQIYVLGERRKEKGKSDGVLPFSFLLSSFSLLALTIGMMLLAGHLQIAFYGLLAGMLWAVALLSARTRQEGRAFALRRLGLCAAGLILGGMLALPQILPAIELSRVSHRVGKPSGTGYALYVEYALPPGGLVMLTLPEFFGNDYDPANPYYGFYVKPLGGGQSVAIRHNAAETAVYVGVIPLLLALFAIARQFLPNGKEDADNTVKRVFDRRVLFFAGLGILALLLALGTPLDALFYFFVPGFGQSGSPARCLVLWTLAVSVLAPFGMDALLDAPPTKREVGVALGGWALVFALGLSMASQMLRANVINLADSKIPVLGDVFGRIGTGWIRLALLTGGGIVLLLLQARSRRPSTASPANAIPSSSSVCTTPALLALALVILDLFWTGININPTASPSAVYPVTPGIRYVQEHAGHERILPINKFWSLYKPPPVVLPPNAGMVYGLRDVQGYDSLLTGQYKAFANTLARTNPDGSLDASPTQVGNMVFIQNPNAPDAQHLGAAFALTLPPSTPNFERVSVAPQGDAVYSAEGDMAVYPLPFSEPRACFETEDIAYANARPPIVYEEDTPTRVTLRVTAPAGSIPTHLILHDQFYPGWRAAIDGTPATIERSGPNGIFRALLVTGGEHRISFRYEPASFRIGLYLACFSAFILSLVTAIGLTCTTPSPKSRK